MKLIAHVARFIVGIIFLISGFVKIVDPIGTAIKLEEYFAVFSADLPFLASFFAFLSQGALILSFLLIVLEIALGIALLILYKMNWTALGLLILIIVFTFLTGYSAILDRVTDCGCFGDALKLTPYQSFFKDLVLTVLILSIYFYRKSFNVIFSHKTGSIVVCVSILMTTLFGYYNVSHLPVIDFRPYKIGNNIPELMDDGEAATYKYVFTNENNGEQIISEKYIMADSLKYDTVLVEGGKEPTIPDFDLRNENDETQNNLVLKGDVFVVVVKDFAKIDADVLQRLNTLSKEAKEKSVPVYYLITSSYSEFHQFIEKTPLVLTKALKIDATVAKAFIRSNPGLVFLKDGTVVNKWHYNDFPKTIKNVIKHD